MFWKRKPKPESKGKQRKARSASETASDGLEAIRRSRARGDSATLDFSAAPAGPADRVQTRLMRSDASGAGWGRHSTRTEVEELPDDVHFNLPDEVVGTLSPSLARAHMLLPYRIEHSVLHVACDRKPSARVTARIEHELRVIAGLELSPRFRRVPSAPLTRLVNTYYPPGEVEPATPDELELEADAFGDPEAEALTLFSDGGGTLPVHFAQRIFIDAVASRAHDVTITAHPRYTRVKFIIDGRGKFYGRRLPRSTSQSLSNIIKTWCAEPASITRGPIHSGFKFATTVDGRIRQIVARVLFEAAPGDDGAENITVRLHGRAGRYLISGFPCTGSEEDVAWLDVDPRARREIADIVSDETAGLVVCVGPIGSGKSTLLSAIIEAHDREAIHFSTVEDPPEFFPDDVKQVALNEQFATYEQNVAATLRSAAKKILISEVRDKRIAAMLEHHATSAQQLFSTFHAEDTVLALDRLRALKFTIHGMASLRTVFGMRLIPKLCNCAVPVKYDHAFLRTAGFTDDLIRRAELRHPVGCPACNKGFSGRVSIIETLRVNERIRDLIRQAGMAPKSHWADWLGRIRAAALDDGLVPLRVLACAQAAAGLVSVKDAIRMTPWCPDTTLVTSDSAAFSNRMLREASQRISDARRLLSARSADADPYTENPDITGPMRTDEIEDEQYSDPTHLHEE